MNVKLINGTKRYFISDKGYCFKVSGIKEISINLQVIKGVPKVKIENRRISLVNLLIEHFIGEISPDSKVTYKIVDGKIPLSTIKIKQLNLSADEDEKLIFNFKCAEKAHAANARVKHTSTISAIDVLNALKRTGYRCFYCGDGVSPKKWHLDHVTPLAIGGLNSAHNITPACKYCNLMKGYIDRDKFLHQCLKIINYNSSEIYEHMDKGI